MWVVRDFCDELPAHTHLSSTLHSLRGKAGRVADRVSLDERVDKDKTKKVRRLDRARIEGSRADRSQIDIDVSIADCRLFPAWEVFTYAFLVPHTSGRDCS